MSPIRKLVPGIVRRFLGGLRFPQLFLITAILFAVNLAVPDPLPFVDEILLALVSLMLGSLRKKDGAGEIEDGGPTGVADRLEGPAADEGRERSEGTDVAGGVGRDEPDDP